MINLPSSYDSWRTATPWDDEKYYCDVCEKEIKEYEYIDNNCLCDSCVEKGNNDD